MEINGVAHTFLTTGNFPAARAFYGHLLPYLGLKPVIDGDGYYYCIGGKTGVGIRASDRQDEDNRFDQQAAGLLPDCPASPSRAQRDSISCMPSLPTAMIQSAFTGFCPAAIVMRKLFGETALRVIRNADRAVFMEKGRVRFEGPAQDLLERDDLVRAVFLGGEGG